MRRKAIGLLLFLFLGITTFAPPLDWLISVTASMPVSGSRKFTIRKDTQKSTSKTGPPLVTSP